ncbi:MAG: dihydrofolate reductase, partial [Clostridiales bacterium]|nr:dihydrofolate reductase [Clostridiales bacterium]
MIALIVAHSRNRVIGNKGHMPWNLKNELKRFKALTTDHVVVM